MSRDGFEWRMGSVYGARAEPVEIGLKSRSQNVKTREVAVAVDSPALLENVSK